MKRNTLRFAAVLFAALGAGGLLNLSRAYAQPPERQPASQQPPNQQPPNQQYDPRSDEGPARPRDLLALQDDLNLLDNSLTSIARRHPRYDEFQQRTAEIRDDVTELAARVRDDRRDQRSDPYERPYVDRGPTATRSEVTQLRQRIASLQDDIENASRRRWGNGDFVLPAGTEIELMLDTSLSSRYSNPEDRVEASTVAALRSRSGRTLVPAGASVAGWVREVRSRDRGQQDGWLRLDFDSITPEGGSRLDLRSHVIAVSETRTGDKSLKHGGLGALLGGVIGGIVDGKKGAFIGAAVGAGGGLLATKGTELDLPEGTMLVIRLDRPLSIPRR